MKEQRTKSFRISPYSNTPEDIEREINRMNANGHWLVKSMVSANCDSRDYVIIVFERDIRVTDVAAKIRL